MTFTLLKKESDLIQNDSQQLNLQRQNPIQTANLKIKTKSNASYAIVFWHGSEMDNQDTTCKIIKILKAICSAGDSFGQDTIISQIV